MITSFEIKIIRRYREIHKHSRAVNLYTLYGSGGKVRRATCIFCRKVVATCSNTWPETITFRQKAYEHCSQCAMFWYCDGQVKDRKKQLKRK